ncbi:Pycsar system effector family protein [Streptomyces sp. ODS28]|uniref:Pycsar system effector family protein n=1 Tax=Streptomyces sp. ODS28 TaxID=3136688 RepID=UPI0031E644F8
MPEPDTRYVAERLLSSVREDLGRADSKAAILVSGAVGLVAMLVSANDVPGVNSGAGYGGWTAPHTVSVLALIGGLLWGSGVVMLVAVLLPRTRVAADRTFLRELTSGVSPEALMPKLAESGEDVVRWTLDQACALGAVLARKYAWLRLGVCCLALGALFTLFSQLW